MSLGLDLSSKSHVDIKGVAAAALNSLPALLADWLPGGRREGREYVVRNPNRSDARPGSFKINMTTGHWSDFATGDKGGDAVSLFASLNGKSQMEAAHAVADQIGFTQSVAKVATVADPSKKCADAAADKWLPIIPVPVDAPKLLDSFVRGFAKPGYKLVEGYRYDTFNGEWIGSIARFEAPGDGDKKHKEFRPFTFCQHPDGRNEWRCKALPDPRPLYGLQLLAERPAALVLVVEGERPADAARRMLVDYVVVTSPNGSKSARKADWSPLAGRRVVIWPDADAPGASYALDVAEMARAAGAVAVGVVKLPAGLPEGWDLADDMPAGITHAGILKAIVDAKPAADGPLPLFPPLPPAEPFPVDALGPTLSRATAAISNKVQVPHAMAAQSVLAAAALAAQAHADVMLPYGQTRPLSLFFVTVAASGDRKSSSDNEALWPVTKREKTLREESVEEMKEWRAARDAWGAEHKKFESDKKYDRIQRKDALALLGDEPAKPLAPFLTTGDLTLEGLTKNWINAHPALGIFTAEAGTFTGGHGMSEDNRLRTAAMLSEVWDGKPVKRVRALDGVTILPGRRLSMHLMVQPGAAMGFLGNSTLRDQGLLSRVLVSAPPSLAGTRLHRAVDPADDSAIRSYGARILSLLEAPPATVPGVSNELDPPALRIDAAAASALSHFADHVEHQVGSAEGLKPIGDFAAKAAEHAARIAGVLAIVANHQATTIGMDVMAGALTLADWYVCETLRLQQAGRRDPKLLSAADLLQWMQKQDSEVDFRDVLRFGPAATRIKTEAEISIKILADHGWIVETAPRPRRFKVMPSEDRT